MPTTQPPAALPPSEDLPDHLHALIPGHNQLEADRINLVFAAHEMPEAYDWVTYARTLLTWEGPVPVELGGSTEVAADDAADLRYGVFAIEPFRSFRDSFNIWYVDTAAPDRWGWRHNAATPPVILPDMVEITLSGDPDGPPQAFFPGFVGPTLPTIGGANFGAVAIPVYDPAFALLDSQTLTHEFGHSLFGLGDKYDFSSYGPNPRTVGQSVYPSCAGDRATADEFFGDLIGVLDPAYDDVFLSDLARFGVERDLDDIERERDALTVGFVDDGCFGPAGVALRSTSEGLMNGAGSVPVMGAANRRWAEAVLGVWRDGPS